MNLNEWFIREQKEDGRNYTLTSFANKNICGGEIKDACWDDVLE